VPVKKRRIFSLPCLTQRNGPARVRAYARPMLTSRLLLVELRLVAVAVAAVASSALSTGGASPRRQFIAGAGAGVAAAYSATSPALAIQRDMEYYNPEEFERIWDTAAGKWLPSASAANLPRNVLEAGSGIVVIGENHGSQAHHHAQLEIIRQLQAERVKDPSRPPLAIGLEMFYRQQQPLLDRFIFANASAPYTIRDLERDSSWASTWGYDINSGYSKIFAYARQVLVRAKMWLISLSSCHQSLHAS